MSAKMRRFLLGAVFLLTWCSRVDARTDLPASPTVESFRPIGEIRVWTFFGKDSTLGTLRSEIAEAITYDDIPGVLVQNELSLDQNKLEIPVQITAELERKITSHGGILSEDLEMTLNGENVSVRVRREADSLETSIRQRGTTRERTVAFGESGFSADGYFVDQFEIYWALHDLAVGDTLRDTIFVTQTQSTVPFMATVDSFFHFEISRNRYDSVFAIHVRQPQPMNHYFTATKRLVKVEYVGQPYKAYLDEISRPQQSAPSAAAAQTRPLGRVVLAYFVFLLVGIAAIAFFIGHAFRWRVVYLGLLAGGLAYGLLVFTQIPLQRWMFETWVMPAVRGESSILLWSIPPSLAVGVLQTAVLLALIFVFRRSFDQKGRRLVAIGTMIGAGFGVVEACYLSGGALASQLLSWTLVERSFTIIFHVASGTMLALALVRQRGWLWSVAPAVVLVNSLFRYLPVLVTTRAFTLELLNIALALVATLCALVVLVFLRQKTE